jgi:hypothetical protein
MEKLAYHSHHCSEIEDYLNEVTTEDGYAYILILALGSSDIYGCNRNGDWFSEQELLESYKTFETGPAYLYRHHQNKDPNNSYGKVVKAFYNPVMKRVEIVVRLDISKAPDIMEKLLSGQPVATSMGCKVAYDECSVCRNRAKTRVEYCDHLRESMRHIDETGRQTYAINVRPRFFDMSLVFRPADRTSYVLKKVASELAYQQDYSSALLGDVQEKMAMLRKISDIAKVLRGYPVGLKSDSGEYKAVKHYADYQAERLVEDYPPLPLGFLDELAEYPLDQTNSTLNECGVSLSDPEICTLSVARHNNLLPSEVPFSVGRIMAQMLPSIISALSNREGVVTRAMEESPEFMGSKNFRVAIIKLSEKFPDSRRLDNDSLVEKVAGWKSLSSDIASRPRNIMIERREESQGIYNSVLNLARLDGPGLQETIQIRLPDGRSLLVTREELLFSGAGAHDILGLALSPAAIVAGLVSASVAAPFFPSTQYGKLPYSEQDILNAPGLRGKFASSSVRVEKPGMITKLAADIKLTGGWTPVRELSLLKNASYREFVDKLDTIIKNRLYDMVEY